MICFMIMLLLTYVPPKDSNIEPAAFGMLGCVEGLLELPLLYDFGYLIINYLKHLQ